MEDSVSTLVEANHNFLEIPDYTMPQFLIMLRAAERRVAERRVQFITDMSTVVGGLFGGGDSLTKHLSSLTGLVNEESSNGGPQ